MRILFWTTMKKLHFIHLSHSTCRWFGLVGSVIGRICEVIQCLA